MLKNMVIFMLMSILLISCATQPGQRTYRDLLNNDDFAFERYSPEFIKEARKECPAMLNDLGKLKAEISGHEGVFKKKQNEYKWLKGWVDILDCEYDKSKREISPAKKDKTVAEEVKPTITESSAGKQKAVVKEDTSNVNQPDVRKMKPSAVVPLSFDECFQKCKELTSRTNEKCFDVCLNR